MPRDSACLCAIFWRAQSLRVIPAYAAGVCTKNAGAKVTLAQVQIFQE